jgi:hypothetical protein
MSAYRQQVLGSVEIQSGTGLVTNAVKLRLTCTVGEVWGWVGIWVVSPNGRDA